MTQTTPNWPLVPPTWTNATIDTLRDGSTIVEHNEQSETLSSIITKSNKFPIQFPIDTIRCETLTSTVNKETLQRNLTSAYPVIHEYGLYLCAKFLLYKRENGTKIEQNFYKNITVIGLIDRLLSKRAVMFMGKRDTWILLDGTKGTGNWQTIGKNDQKMPLILEDYISYDEIKISALLSVSSYSYFINNGTRKNKGVVAKSRENIQPEGVVIGLIGARLKLQNKMEFQEIVVTKTQNIPENKTASLSAVFADFYDEPYFTYDEVVSAQNNGRFTKLEGGQFFDNILYSKRLSLSFDTLLLEANHRATEAKLFAYIHVVGIGLGVWKASPHQENVFVETFFQRIKSLEDSLQNVSDVDFSYMGNNIKVKNYFDGSFLKIQGHPKGGIKIHVSKRDPYTKIENGKLLVVSYAWDGNALPGNEFWKGQLCSTGDSSTASSTQVSELHNPHINGNVCAQNLRVVTSKRLTTIQNYIKQLN